MIRKILHKTIDRRAKGYLRLYHSLWKRSRFPSIDHLIQTWAKSKEEVFFVQIGANEGSTEDPLYRHIRLKNWKGILVEPFRESFDRLRENFFHNPDLIFEQAALSSENKELPFYYIHRRDPSVPQWVSKLNSFDRAIPQEVRDKFGDKVEIRETAVQCIRFDQLLKKHQVQSVDLVFLDTEGHDYEILKTIDLRSFQPEVVVYEHRHLSSRDQKMARAYLRESGYVLYQGPFDTAGMRDEALIRKYKGYLLE